MAKNRKPQTPFGVRVSTFCAKAGMSASALAENSGVKYSTLLDCKIGRSVGIELVPKVDAFMDDFRKAHPELFKEEA